ncbi:hypothetical protein C6369_000570 [Rhodococcus rhodochrous]|nr:hypothetical protein C6369_000570 [Rhodococcus rhodochrous]
MTISCQDQPNGEIMSYALLVARVQPSSPEHTDEFHRWYDEVHIPQVLERIPGVVGKSMSHLASFLKQVSAAASWRKEAKFSP